MCVCLSEILLNFDLENQKNNNNYQQTEGGVRGVVIAFFFVHWLGYFHNLNSLIKRSKSIKKEKGLIK